METFSEEKINILLSNNDLLENSLSITGKKILFLLKDGPKSLIELKDLTGRGDKTIYSQLAILKNELLIEKKEKKFFII